MNQDTLTIVRLTSFETINEILDYELPCGTKPNGNAILFAKGQDSFLLNRDFTLMGLNQLSQHLSSMSSIRPGLSDGDIDSELKMFLKEYVRIGTWTLNSSSVVRSDLKEFHDFDKMELKQMLLNLANKL